MATADAVLAAVAVCGGPHYPCAVSEGTHPRCTSVASFLSAPGTQTEFVDDFGLVLEKYDEFAP